MLFPSDFLKGKEKRAYKKQGKVVKWNMYTEILQRAEFDMRSPEEQKAMFTYWRNNYTNAEIMKGMKVSSNTITRLAEQFGLPLKSRGGNTKRKGAGKAKEKQKEEGLVPVSAYLMDEKVAPRPVEVKQDGLAFSFNGKYAPNQIISKLEKLQLLLDGEESDFEIELRVRELE